MGSTALFNPHEMPGWDYATDLVITRRVVVDRARVVAECRLDPSVGLALITLWHARGTGLMGSSPAASVVDDAPVVTSVDLVGGELGGDLVLRTRLVLAENHDGGGPLVAHRKGSILWESGVHAVSLEGGLSRFPVSPIDFREHPHLHNGALWALDWDPTDLDRPALGALCLYVNTGHPAHGELTGEGGPTAVVELLRSDIARTILDGVLEDDDFERRDDDGAGETLGDVVGRLLDVVFPGVSTQEVRALRRARRSKFDTSIQAAFGIGGR